MRTRPTIRPAALTACARASTLTPAETQMATTAPRAPEPMERDLASRAAENERLRAQLDELLVENGRLRRERDAVGGVLRAMADTADLAAVLHSLAERAAALVGAESAVVYRRAGDGGEDTLLRAGGWSSEGGRGSTGERTIVRPQVPFGLAVLERRTVHLPDVRAVWDRYDETWRTTMRRLDVGTYLVAPLLLRGDPVGALSVRRAGAPRPFSETEIALVETFAAEAAVAVENARLIADLRSSLDQQTATAEVLRVIAGQPADLVAVLSSIGDAAARLFATDAAQVWLVEGTDRLRLMSNGRGGPARLKEGAERPTGRDTVAGRAIADRQPVVIPDLQAMPAGELPHPGARRAGTRTMIAVPLLHGSEAIGAIALNWPYIRAITPHETALLSSFADQGVIAVQNARLFSELQESNATLTEALEQQTATADILRAIASSPKDAQPVFDAIVEGAVRVCGAVGSVLWRVDGDELVGLALHAAEPLPRATVGTRPLSARQPIKPDAPPGRAMVERCAVQVVDGAVNPGAGFDGEWLEGVFRRQGTRTFMAVPLLRESAAVGVLTVRRVEARPFSEREVALLETFASQAVIAVENARLFQELQESNATLKQALEQQTALGEILRIISRSPSDVWPVLDAITERAALLCGASDAIFHRADPDGATMRMVASYGRRAAEIAAVTATGPVSLTRGRLAGRAILDRRTICVADMAAEDEAEYAESKELQRRFGFRSVVATPVLREGVPLGAISLRRFEVDPFTESQVKLLETFADQAAIAIENARLFGELRERDERRRRELERASAIQQRLLPSSVEAWPGVLELAVRFRPAVETSGDFYDVLRLPAARKGELEPLQIAVGDVAGKGMSAALVTALARAALQASASVPPGMATPAATLRVAGQRLHEDVGAQHFLACALALVEPPGLHHAGPRIRLANAAQVPVLLVRDGAAREVEPPGYRLPLGTQSDGDYKDVEADLQPGDVVVFSSDGLVEAPALAQAMPGDHLPAPGKAGELFGFERLQRSAVRWSQHAGTAEDAAAGIWADLTAWCGEESHHDDVTLLVLRVPAAP